MKKLFFVLILIVAGTLAFLLMQSSSQQTPEVPTVAERPSIERELANFVPVCPIDMTSHYVRIEEKIAGGFKVVTAPWEWHGEGPFPEARFTVMINDKTQFCHNITAQYLGPDEASHYSTFIFRTTEERAGVRYPEIKEGAVVTAAEITIP
jgi:hypothetical protein